MSHLRDAFCCSVKTTGSALSAIGNAAGFSGISFAGEALKLICEICQDAADTHKGFRQIHRKATDFRGLVTNVEEKGEGCHEELDALVEGLRTRMEDVLARCKKFSDKPRRYYIFQPLRAKEALEDCAQELEGIKEVFNSKSLIIIAQGVKRVEDGQENIAQQQMLITDKQDVQLEHSVALSQGQAKLISAVQDGFAAYGRGQIEVWIKENPGRARELLSPNDLETTSGPEREKYRTLVGALIENGGGALKDLDDMIVRGDEIVPGAVWVGHLKDRGSKMPQKFWVQKVDANVTSQADVGGQGETKATRRLREEMRIAVAIRHPNLMRLYGMFVDTTDIIPKVFTVSQFEDYKILDRYLQTSDENPIGILTGVAGGLTYLHEQHGAQPLVHGDVRCRKVAVTPDGTAKIFDLALAVVIQEVTENNLITRTSRDSSVWWTAPEIFEEAIPTPASDVWSLAITMIECLSVREDYAREEDHHPFPQFSRNTKLPFYFAEIKNDPEKKFEYSDSVRPKSAYAKKWGTPEVWDLILSCLQMDPHTRPSTSAVQRRLQDIS